MHIAFARYLIVGALANALVLGIYLLLSLFLGFTPKVAITFASALAFLFSYGGNKFWTFGHQNQGTTPLVRFAICYLASFALQWIVLDIGSYRLGYPHEWIVLFGLAVATLFSFLAQRFWVFRKARRAAAQNSG